ncbi:uncharacterized protein STEHIDRAFT_168352 [Stereum hirsutum FP-91666 SS1]|uniref:uncharacterized protein n=1 Tax=Stereum hirsutum (strain FP-91666) TaxID=721885 RepID=UPI000440C0FB|nr:uncharacterized protein STEHIDRAFT_168352 [Stereum hirsutum FP-91666 SS1]EIM87660.1 hypothetical protein STEHIDRAFT_168352 [Stereum hirsutum FP-91666 SS1]
MKDPYASHVVAVTANVQRDATNSLVLVSQNANSSTSLPKTELKSLGPDESIGGDEILKGWATRDLASHSKNVFAIIDTLRKDNPDLESAVLRENLFHRYAVNHCHVKIAGRILKGNSLWTTHPMDALAAYPLSELRDRLLFPRTLQVANAIVGWLEAEYGIQPVPRMPSTTASDSRSASFEVTRDNVGQWVKALTDTFSHLKDELISNRRYKDALGEQEALRASLHLFLFHHLLRCRIIDFLLSDESLAEKMVKRQSHILGLNIGLAEPGGGENPEEAQETDDEDDDVFVEDRTPDPSGSRGPIVRYLRTIVAWTAAAESLAHRPPPSPIHAHLVSIPHPTIPDLDTAIAKFKIRILEHPGLQGSKDAAAALLERDFRLKPKAVKNATVHVETLMMALAHAFWSPGVAKESQNKLDMTEEGRKVLLDVFQTPIATSKKCCWCCWQLYRYWHPDDGLHARSSGDAPPDIVLLGSHSTIFPWYPPSVGVPIEFLRELEAKLETILLDVMKEGSKSQSKSGQSSARTSSEDDRPKHGAKVLQLFFNDLSVS